MSSQGIFAVGRARVHNRGRKDPVRSASSLAAAARRPGPARRSRTTAEATPAATPTLTSLTIPNSSMSRRRLAGTSGEPTAAEAGPAHASPESGLRAVDPMDIWLQAVSGPLGRTAPLSRASGGGAGRHAAPASAAGPALPAARTSPGSGVGQPQWTAPVHQPEAKPAVAGREAPIRGPVAPPHTLRRVVDPAGGHRPPHRSATKSPPTSPEPKRRRSRTKKSSTAGRSRSSTSGPAKRSTRKRILGWTLLGAGAVILLGTAWVGWRTYQAYDHLQAASQNVTELQEELRDITTSDPTATAGTVGDLQAEASSARSAVDDPLFQAATGLPFVGPNLDAIREVTLTVDSLATDVMPSLVEIANTLQPSELAPKDGAIDLAPIERISPLLQSADVAVNEAIVTLGTIDRSQLVQPIGDAVGTLSDKLDAAAHVTGPGARTARLLPPMLGANGTRQYLVVFQNPAELRATGGIFGSYALVTADNGKITIVDQGASSRTLGFFEPPVAELPPNELSLYGTQMAQYPMDVNFTPDYPTAAELFAEMYRVRTSTTVDGVLAVDPVALSYTLEGAPGVDIGGGQTLTSDNLVSTLLSTAYQQFADVEDQDERDAYLDNATSTVFSNVMSGKGDPRAIIDGLRKAADERRVLVFSSHADEQADIAKTGLAGSLDTQAERPSIGVFLNDGTGAKMDYYLRNEVHVTDGGCRADGRREMQVRVVVNYDAPSEGLPDYVSGAREPGQPYLLRTNVLAFAPVGGGVVEATRDGAALPIGRGQDHDREVGTATIELLPGDSTELTFTVVGPAGSVGGPGDVPPSLILTPGVNPWVTSVEDFQGCTPSVG